MKFLTTPLDLDLFFNTKFTVHVLNGLYLHQGSTEGRRSSAEAEVFSQSALVAEGYRPKLLAKGLGHIFGKIFRFDGQSLLIIISFLQFLFLRYKKN